MTVRSEEAGGCDVNDMNNWFTKMLFILGSILAFLIAILGAYKA